MIQPHSHHHQPLPRSPSPPSQEFAGHTTATRGGGEAKSATSSWLILGVRVQEDDILEQRSAFILLGGTWRFESVAVKVPVSASAYGLLLAGKGGADMRRHAEKLVVAEAAFLSTIRHENIVRMYGTIELATTGLPCLVLERLHESVDQRRNRGASPMTFRDIVDVAYGITHALRYLHEHSPQLPIAHRDISSRNILLSAKGIGKLGGMSTARVLSGRQAASRLRGAEEYMPPETALGDRPQYTVKVDVFSLGVVVMEMGVGEAPAPLVRFASRARGGVSLVPEAKRRAEELRKLKVLHPLLVPAVLQCIQEEKRRLTSSDLLDILVRLRSEAVYKLTAFTLDITASGAQKGAAPRKPPRNQAGSVGSSESAPPDDDDDAEYAEIDYIPTSDDKPGTGTLSAGYSVLEGKFLNKQGLVQVKPPHPRQPSPGAAPSYFTIPERNDRGDADQDDGYALLEDEDEYEDVVIAEDTHEVDGYSVPCDSNLPPENTSQAQSCSIYAELEATADQEDEPSPPKDAHRSSKGKAPAYTNPTYDTEIGSTSVYPPADTAIEDDEPDFYSLADGPEPDEDDSDIYSMAEQGMTGGGEGFQAGKPITGSGSHFQGSSRSECSEPRGNLQLNPGPRHTATNEYVLTPHTVVPPSFTAIDGDLHLSSPEKPAPEKVKSPPPPPTADLGTGRQPSYEEVAGPVVKVKFTTPPPRQPQHKVEKPPIVKSRSAPSVSDRQQQPLPVQPSLPRKPKPGVSQKPSVPGQVVKTTGSSGKNSGCSSGNNSDAAPCRPQLALNSRSSGNVHHSSAAKLSAVPESAEGMSKVAEGPLYDCTTGVLAEVAEADLVESPYDMGEIPATPAQDVAQATRRSSGNSSSWYHGRITREEAEAKLRSQMVGCFLVRSGRSHNGFSMSWRSPDSEKPIKHVIIDQPMPGLFQVRNKKIIHSSMEELLKYHRGEPLTDKAFDVVKSGFQQ